MTINLDSIMSKVEKYAQSKEGRQLIADKVDGIRTGDHGVDATDVVEYNDMYEIALELQDYIVRAARENDVPESLIKDIRSLDCPSGSYKVRYKEIGGIRQPVGVYIDLSFMDDLSRMSLKYTDADGVEHRTGEGLYNVLSLFEYGYKAKHPRTHVTGLWEGHEELGIVGRTIKRKPYHFIEDGIQKFMEAYNSLPGVDVYAYVDRLFGSDNRF